MRIIMALASLAVLGMLVPVQAQEHTREYVIDERGRQRAFSRAVATTGGKIVWLAGQTATTDANGNSLNADFEGQTRARSSGFSTSGFEVSAVTYPISLR